MAMLSDVVAEAQTFDAGKLGPIPEGVKRSEWAREQLDRVNIYGLQGVMQQNQATLALALARLGKVPAKGESEEVNVPLSPQEIVEMAKVSPIGSTINYTEQNFSAPAEQVRNPVTAPAETQKPTAETSAGTSVSRGTAAAIAAATLMAGYLVSQFVGKDKEVQPPPPTQPPAITGTLEWEVPLESKTKGTKSTKSSRGTETHVDNK